MSTTGLCQNSISDEPALRLKLPLCPSTNHLNANRRDGKGRAKTTVYKAWINGAGWWLKTQPHRLIDGPVRVSIEAPINRTRDLDNIAKPTLDLLVSKGVIQDDRWVDELRLQRVPNDGESMMWVSLWPMP